MKALEFKSKIKGNQILIPAQIQSELKNKMDRDVRVILLVDETDIYDGLISEQTTQPQLLKGYADTGLVELTNEQIEMLKMSEDDMENGRLISQEAMDKRNLEWLNER